MNTSFLKLTDVLNTNNKVSLPAIEEPVVALVAVNELRIASEDTMGMLARYVRHVLTMNTNSDSSIGSVLITTDVPTLDSDKPGINNSSAISFANLLKGESNMRQVNFRTFPALASNWSDVVISKESVEQVLRGDVELKDTLVVDISKLEGEGYPKSSIHV
uniref:Uncharacterized protein n=1 Tax=Tanacetum cinerariifolium TaxID=118510 RepID=A0A6L2MEU0_TANCI|nr:hypothetical protein [Tanacetum cinerariifolium]